MPVVGDEKFTEGRDYRIQDGIFKLIGITESTVLFTTTRLDKSRVHVVTVKAELQELLKRLTIEERCLESGGKCDKAGCGNCHPENFE